MTNGQDPNPLVQVDLDEINGRLLELQEINHALVQRCGNMRGQIIKKDQEIAQLQLQLTTVQQNMDVLTSKTTMSLEKEVEGHA